MATISEMEAQFNAVAREYDFGRKKFIPCFDDYYEKTTDFVAEILKTPRKVLDLGAGTGLLTMYFFRHFPQAEYLLADIAESMLAVARERFRNQDNVKYCTWDYSKSLPDGIFDLVISALSIHHLEQAQKQALFHQIRQALPEGGVFLNYDQFCADTPEMSATWDRSWIQKLHTSGLTPKDLSKWKERRKLDRECSLNDEISMLKESGFSSVNCLYSCQKFSVILAKK